MKSRAYFCTQVIFFSEMYLLIEFEEGDVAVIPETWEFGDGLKCYWPPYKNPDCLKKAARQQELPDLETWGLFPIKRIMYRGKRILLFEYDIHIN